MHFLEGLKGGFPIGLGYFAVSFSFGIAGSKFLNCFFVTLISMANLTSAGQFAGLKIMEACGTFFEMALATFFINLRYSLMAVSLSQKVDSNFNFIKRILLSIGITDEIYALAMNYKTRISASYFLGLTVLPYVGWTSGTFSGALCGEILPAFLTNALGVALYGMFIAIVVPEMKTKRPVFIAVFIAMAISSLFYFVPCFQRISVGFAIILSSVIASFICAFLFPETKEHR